MFAHTVALAESLPVVSEGGVIKVFSKSKKEVARAAKQYRGQQFEGGDIVEEVTCSRRTVQRVLNELAETGYLAKRETKNGLANEFRAVEGEGPGVGEAELPELDDPFAPADGPASNSAGREGPADHPDETSSSVSSTGFVWVVGSDGEPESGHRSARATLPAPDAPGDAESAAPPG